MSGTWTPPGGPTSGNDTYTGDGDGNSVSGLDGNDLLDGDDGPDSLDGAGGDDSIWGGPGGDFSEGAGGADSLRGNEGDDTLDGGIDNDRLAGGGGSDSLLGGDGDDSIFGGEEADRVDAGPGNDFVYWSSAEGEDSLDGAGGTDILDINLGVAGGGWTTVDGGNGYTQFNLTGPAAGQFFFGRNFETVLCFATGTLIATPRGEVPVEDLREGDLVLTRHGPGIKRIRWIGEQAFDGRFIAADRAPVRIRAGTLGNGLPRRDLVVSPAHAVLVGGVLVDARLLVNGDSIVQERVAGTIAYRHIDLGEHDCVLAEGAWAESYRETGDRRAFLNAASAVERDVEPPCLPHVSAADDPRLPALRARLAVPVARRA